MYRKSALRSRSRGGNRPKLDVFLSFYHYTKLKLEYISKKAEEESSL